MSTYDKAHKLAKELKESDEYTEYKEKRKAVLNDENAKNMLLDYQKKEQKLQTKHISGEELSEEEKEDFENLRNLIQMNDKIKGYLEAEQRLSVMLNDIQKILFGDLEFGINNKESK
ncbi:MAG: YlbF family regulator [Bacillota bacterium]